MRNRIFTAETRRRGVFLNKNRVRLVAFFFSASLCLGGLFSAAAQSDGSQQNKTGRAGTFAIVNARVVTVSGAVIENGTVVIQDGKIVEEGTHQSLMAQPGGRYAALYGAQIQEASA